VKVLFFAVLIVSGFGIAFAEKGTFVDTIQFIQYLDESTAIEEIKKKNLDIYYSRIPAELISDTDTSNLKIFYTTGGSFSILVNPAQGEEFNPFYYQKARFALNYLVDRKLIVDELMSGYGVVMTSNYGPFDPDFLNIVSELERFHFRYNPELANSMISEAMEEAGAQKIDGKWYYDNKQVTVTFFIRNDDPVRKSIGEVISSELEKAGFAVKKDFGDLNKAYVLVYGSDPADLKWSLYTEGYAGRSAFVKYDPLGLAQMYSPWYSNMPGFNNPQYWNYKNEKLDELTQKIYSSNYTSYDERAELIRQATILGVNESVRIFLAAKIDPFVVNKNVDGVINDFGGGIQTRFTPINSRTNDDTLKIGVKQIYQGAWNPVRGLADAYSKNIWDVLYDPGMFKNPYSGQNFAVRQDWAVETAGPTGKLDVPDGAIFWDPAQQKWVSAEGKKATSKVTYDLLWSNWHHGQKMDMNDVLYSVYFTQEWGSAQTQNDKTFDPEYTPTASQSAKTLIAVRPIDDNTIEIYVDYWHFDETEIADWGGVWVTMPWEPMAAMEKAVIDGKASFSRTDSQAKSLNWLSLIIPRDAQLVSQYLKEFSESDYVPPALEKFGNTIQYYDSRYQSTISWIEQKNHAVISNGPFYLDSYSPEARTITVRAFDDESYPFSAGHWSSFEQVSLPQITSIEVPDKIIRGQDITIPITAEHSTDLYYFVNDASGAEITSGIIQVQNGSAEILLDSTITNTMMVGGHDIKVYAISDSVLRPDIYLTSFSAVDKIDETYTETIIESKKPEVQNNYGIISIILGAIIVGVILYIRKSRKSRTNH
jgi:peptide/nickel transport system substrate-binding protein